MSIFCCDTWQVEESFQIDTADVAGMEWCPDGGSLAVWESVLEYKVGSQWGEVAAAQNLFTCPPIHLSSCTCACVRTSNLLLLSRSLLQVLIYSLDGRLLSRFQPLPVSLGVRAVSWEPSGKFLAIGSAAEAVVRILSMRKGAADLVAVLAHSGGVYGGVDTHVYRVRGLPKWVVGWPCSVERGWQVDGKGVESGWKVRQTSAAVSRI